MSVLINWALSHTAHIYAPNPENWAHKVQICSTLMYEYISNYGHNCLYLCAATVAARKAWPSILSNEQSRSSTDRIGTDIKYQITFCRMSWDSSIFHFPIAFRFTSPFALDRCKLYISWASFCIEAESGSHGRDNIQSSYPRSWRKEDTIILRMQCLFSAGIVI